MRHDEQRCVLDHRTEPDRPRPAAHGLLCVGHFHQLYRVLNELAGFPDEAAQASADETVSVSLTPPTSGTKNPPLPVNEARIDHVRRVRGVLASWCQLVAEERGVAVPDDPNPRVTSGFLRLHLDWSAQQGWVDDYAGEVLELGRRAWSLLHPSGVRHIRDIGPCPEDGCDGQITATVRKSDDVMPSSISCSSCLTEITADRWLTYGRRLRAMREVA